MMMPCAQDCAEGACGLALLNRAGDRVRLQNVGEKKISFSFKHFPGYTYTHTHQYLLLSIHGCLLDNQKEGRKEGGREGNIYRFQWKQHYNY